MDVFICKKKIMEMDEESSTIIILYFDLKYKCNKVIEVNPRNTSKTCNRCGRIHEMPLWKRTMECECGNVDDRDVNASKNIHCLGQAILHEGVECTISINEMMLIGSTCL